MIQLFADGADTDGIIKASYNERITGFTTNPTLMRQAGVTDYTSFAKNIISYLSEYRPNTCLSLEVFADDFDEMFNQAMKIDSWGREKDYDIYVKIPITNTKGESSCSLIKKLVDNGIKVNVTAVFTIEQTIGVLVNLDKNVKSIISIFAGRIADTGVDPIPVMREIVRINDGLSQILWASPREVLNYNHAEQAHCDIITMTPDLIKKLDNFGKDLNTFSLETVKMFYNDATKSGFSI